MNLLITGGAGFIGSNFIRHILFTYPDYRIINLDKLTYAGNLENLKDIENYPRYGFVKGDICDRELVDRLVSRRPDAIINFAAHSHVDRSILDPTAFIHDNFIGVQILLEAAKKHKVERFVQVSTDEVYGSVDEGYCDEGAKLDPRNPYSVSKAAADLLSLSYSKTHGVPVIITRSSNNFGPHQFPEKLIPLFITNLLEGKKVPLYGDGMNLRDWLHVADNCEAIDRVLHEGNAGEIYNIAGANERTNREITEVILEELGKDESSITYVEDRPGHDRRYAISAAKIQSLGWEPKYRFKEALRDTIAWYRNNEEWWRRIKSGAYQDYYQKQYGGRKVLHDASALPIA